MGRGAGFSHKVTKGRRQGNEGQTNPATGTDSERHEVFADGQRELLVEGKRKGLFRWFRCGAQFAGFV